VTTLDPNARATATAAFSWALYDDEPGQVRTCINKLTRSEEVLAALRACRDLAAMLERRHHEIAEKALADLEAEMVAVAVLTPDALPDNVEGYSLTGVHTPREA
jgi:hypothetical protein